MKKYGISPEKQAKIKKLQREEEKAKKRAERVLERDSRRR